MDGKIKIHMVTLKFVLQKKANKDINSSSSLCSLLFISHLLEFSANNNRNNVKPSHLIFFDETST